jgi:6-phosphogluconate dehydrogenase
MEKRIGMVGLGRMGGNMARRIARAGLEVTAWDGAAGARAGLAAEPRVAVVETLAALVEALPAPRVVWLMLPAGAPTEQTVGELRGLLAPGDLVVDGANAWYRDSIRRAAELAPLGLQYVDAGVSGGVWGLVNGYGLMVGGPPEAVRRVEPLFARPMLLKMSSWPSAKPAGPMGGVAPRKTPPGRWAGLG